MAATPAAPLIAAAARSGLADGETPAAEWSRVARLVSPVGSAPVVVEWSALSEGASTARVFDAQGRLVQVCRSPAARSGRIVWDGRDQGGSPVRHGIYFLRLERGARSDGVKAVVMGR